MEHAFEEISISSGATRVRIAPERGGLVTSFSIRNTEIFYFDRGTFNDENKNVRGGIPILFPNAGPLKGGLYNLPQHGFARRMPWNVIGQNHNSINLQLLSNEETREKYPFDFEMKLEVEVAENNLTHTLTVTNTGGKPMPTTYGTHPYFEIEAAEKENLITNIESFKPKEINWMEEFDKPFINSGSIKIQMHSKEITIESDPNIFKFARVWHQATKNFICIEPWTRDNFALDNPNQSLWIKSDESITLSIFIHVKIIK